MKQRHVVKNIVKKHTFSFNKPKIELDKKKESRKNGYTDELLAREQLEFLEEEE